MAEFVSVHSSGGLATIRLDRPPVNALSIALQGELLDAAERVSVDPDIRAAVIYGGEKVFAAGADVELWSVRGSRRVAVADFVVGPKRNVLEPDEIASRNQLKTRMLEVVQTLPLAQKQAMILCLEEFSFKEIGETLGTSAHTARMRCQPS